MKIKTAVKIHRIVTVTFVSFRFVSFPGSALYAVPPKNVPSGGGGGETRGKSRSLFHSALLKFELAMAAFSGLFLPAAEK